MDTSVCDKFFNSNASNLSANWIKTRKNYNFWCVVNDKFYTGSIFQSANVATFTTNQTALHFVIWQRNCCYCSFTNLIASATLNSCGNNSTSTLFACFSSFRFDIANNSCGFASSIGNHTFNKHLLCFFASKSCNTFQFLLDTFFGLSQILSSSCKFVLLINEFTLLNVNLVKLFK